MFLEVDDFAVSIEELDLAPLGVLLELLEWVWEVPAAVVLGLVALLAMGEEVWE